MLRVPPRSTPLYSSAAYELYKTPLYLLWQTLNNKIYPSLPEMKVTIIRLTDQLRLLDQDMIRLQQKVNTVLELKEENKLKDENEK